MEERLLELELDRVVLWRIEQLELLGLTYSDASVLARARHVDLDTFRRLVARGATPDEARRILL